jgi:hypothetical protein
MVKKQAKNENGAKISNAQEKAMIQQNIDTHKPNVRQLKYAVAKQKQNIEFTEREVELLKKYPSSDFVKTQGIKYESNPDYLEFAKEARIAAMELQLVQAKEEYEINLKSYELESAKLRILESGKLYYGMSDEEILKH